MSAQAAVFLLFLAAFVLLSGLPEVIIAALISTPFLYAFQFQNVTLLYAILCLLAVILLFRSFSRVSSFFGQLNDPSLILVILFFVYVIANWYFSPQDDRILGFGKIKLLFIRGIIPLLLLATFNDSLKRFRHFLVFFLFFSMYSSLLIIATISGIHVSQGVDWSEGNRIALFGVDPISFAISPAVSCLIALHLILENHRPWLKIIIAIVLGISFFSIFPTGTRQVLLALFLSSIVYLYFLYPSPWARIRTIAVFAVVMVVLFFLVLGQYRTTRYALNVQAAGRSVSSQGRIDTIKQGLETFVSSPLFGVGAGGFGTYIYVTNPFTGKAIRDKTHVHNLFVEVLAEQGMIGFFLFLGALMASFLKVWTLSRRRSSDQESRRSAAILMGMLFFVFIQANISGGIDISGSLLVLIISWVSILCRQWNRLQFQSNARR